MHQITHILSIGTRYTIPLFEVTVNQIRWLLWQSALARPIESRRGLGSQSEADLVQVSTEVQLRAEEAGVGGCDALDFRSGSGERVQKQI